MVEREVNSNNAWENLLSKSSFF